MRARIVVLFSAVLLMTSLASADYVQTNLVSDGSVSALHTDPSLINPWGVAFSATSPFWVGDNGTGLSTLYNSTGLKQGLVVTIPPGGGTGAPTGVVFNGISANFHGDTFLFATENGTLAGWRGALGPTAETLFTNPAGADYTGLAIIGTKAYLANNAAGGGLDIWDSGTNTLNSFFDPTAPAGYAPFNVQVINGKVYVTFAKTTGGIVGEGFVDVFDPATNSFTRLINLGGVLADPWGMALAPTTFGQFGGDLLVGNFADGRINAFNNTTGAFLGTLADMNGVAFVNESLWDITFGNGGNGGDKNTLYLTAGLQDEQHGLFASITAVPEPMSLMLMGSGLAGILLRRKQLTR